MPLVPEGMDSGEEMVKVEVGEEVVRYSSGIIDALKEQVIGSLWGSAAERTVEGNSNVTSSQYTATSLNRHSPSANTVSLDECLLFNQELLHIITCATVCNYYV